MCKDKTFFNIVCYKCSQDSGRRSSDSDEE